LHVLPHLGHHEKYPFTAVRARGASLKATEQPIDTSTAAGKCFLDMLGVFAEFETNLRRERSLRAGVLVSIGCSIAFKAASSPVSSSYITAPGLTPARTLRSLKRWTERCLSQGACHDTQPVCNRAILSWAGHPHARPISARIWN
jgi:hypothetical protein